MLLAKINAEKARSYILNYSLSDCHPHKLITTSVHTHTHTYSRGMMDENNEQFVAYFLPAYDTMVKRKEDQRAGVSYAEDEE